MVDKAVEEIPNVEKIFTFSRNKKELQMKSSIDVNASAEMGKYPAYCAPEVMDSEDTLFLLYTSGSTGQPKVRLNAFWFSREYDCGSLNHHRESFTRRLDTFFTRNSPIR